MRLKSFDPTVYKQERDRLLDRAFKQYDAMMLVILPEDKESREKLLACAELMKKALTGASVGYWAQSRKDALQAAKLEDTVVGRPPRTLKVPARSWRTVYRTFENAYKAHRAMRAWEKKT